MLTELLKKECVCHTCKPISTDEFGRKYFICDNCGKIVYIKF